MRCWKDLKYSDLGYRNVLMLAQALSLWSGHWKRERPCSHHPLYQRSSILAAPQSATSQSSRTTPRDDVELEPLRRLPLPQVGAPLVRDTA